MRPRRAVLKRSHLVLIVVLGVSACSRGLDPVPLPEVEAEIEDDGCENQVRAVTTVDNRLEDELTGDIDGNGSDDPVRIYLDRSSDAGCRAFVVVETEDVVASEPIWEIGGEGGLPQPRLNSLAQIDGRPGLEILVDEIAGASTQFVGAFTFMDGALERLEPVEPAEDLWSGASDGVFPYGGSVGHVEAVDCVADGEIVVSVALPGETPSKVERGIYTVTRRFFRVEGAELLATKTEEKEVRFDFGKTYPEFGSSPFGSCPAA